MVAIITGIAGVLEWIPFNICFSTSNDAVATPQATHATVQLQPVTNGGEPRFSDIAANYYSTTFEKSFNYDIPAYAKLTYKRKSESFTGQLAVSGLKPNFAYQMKLVGTPDHKDSMEKLGFRGRWLLPGGGTNFTDDDYRNLEDKSKVESYIFFDWFITDSKGTARKDFKLDSCLHVLMSKTLEGSTPPDDSMLKKFEVALFHPPAYDKAYDPGEVEIWAMSESEWSHNRPDIGKLKLKEGKYSCLFRLTEECFHGKGGGYWATAMEQRIEFEISSYLFR